MKLFEVILLLLLLHEAACTHLETCDCHEIQGLVNKSAEQQVHEIKAIVNTTVEEAVARLEYKLSHKINTAISGINTTNGIELSDLENNLKSTMVEFLRPIQRQLDYHLPPPLGSEDNPAESCKAVYDTVPDPPSGYYWITETSDSPIRVYCKMNATCEHLKGGWMRVAYLDMRNSSHQCPSGFSLTTRSSNPRRVCDMTGYNMCVSTRFPVHGMRYSHVYGRITAYQNGYPSAFYYNSRRVDQPYVFGVSLTHGHNPRKHIWTLAGAIDETTSSTRNKCPCINTNIHSTITIPSFVGNDYFCDTTLINYYSNYNKGFYPNDPLWDGQGCGPTNTCCSVPSECNNSPPWFIKNLPSPTTDDVEMRLCKPDGSGTTPIETVELYVQ